MGLRKKKLKIKKFLMQAKKEENKNIKKIKKS